LPISLLSTFQLHHLTFLPISSPSPAIATPRSSSRTTDQAVLAATYVLTGTHTPTHALFRRLPENKLEDTQTLSGNKFNTQTGSSVLHSSSTLRTLPSRSTLTRAITASTNTINSPPQFISRLPDTWTALTDTNIHELK
jgi:hypothetical protein